MQHVQTLGQNGAAVRQAPDLNLPTGVAQTVKEIPYDYVATFTLQGRRGNRVQDVINISTDGAFVAVAIGYSFIPAQLPDRRDELDNLKGAISRYISLKIATWVAREGEVDILTDGGSSPSFTGQLAEDIFIDPRMLIQCLLVKLCGIDFKYSIVDSGSGRELQNLSIHNIAGLGEATGDRPFRPMAKPMLFMPRSTIRIEVEEISEGFIYGYADASGRRIGAELFIVLHGYKMLGYGTGLP